MEGASPGACLAVLVHTHKDKVMGIRGRACGGFWFWRLVRWFSRAVLIGITVTYALIGRWFVIDPAGAAPSAVTPASDAVATEMPAGIGGFPFGCAVILVGCILSARRHVRGSPSARRLSPLFSPTGSTAFWRTVPSLSRVGC
jgi:hypothetical protein